MIIINDEQALRLPCEDVSIEELGSLRNVLEQELNNANRLGKNGIGLAAPQIGIAKNIAIIRLPKISLDLVNCKIVKAYDPTLYREEGCLSFPGRVEDTIRYQEVYIDNNLVEPHSFVATGLLSVVCQHELDHLNSVLFMDRMAPKQSTIVNKNKMRPNDPCNCGSGKKYKRCPCH